MATGLGKTLTSALIVKEYCPKRVLFLVHNNFILAHAKSEFERIFDSARIATYNGIEKDGAHDAFIVFATWQTMGENLQSWSKDHFDLVIADEAHHEAAPTYRPVMEHFTGARLGLTATPNRMDDSDIRDTFGKEAINIPLEEAIALQYLSSIEYHVMSYVDREAVQAVFEKLNTGVRYSVPEIDRALFFKECDEEIARIIREKAQGRTVVFCSSIEHAERMATLLQGSAIHSKVSDSQEASWDDNQAALELFKEGSLRFITAVNILNEGVDVPSIETVVFCRQTASETIFRQQLGRGLRKALGKKLLVLDFVSNLDRIISIKAMMNEITRIYTERGLSKETDESSPFVVSGTGFTFAFEDTMRDVVELLRRISVSFYATWQEAGVAAQTLGIKGCVEYSKRYREDPRLHSAPKKFYPDFPGWSVFLNTGRKTPVQNPYTTCAEASVAAQTLGIESGSKYRKRYCEDPRLPSNPSKVYKDFPGLNVFLNTGRKAFVQNQYTTWQEAGAAAQCLGIKSYPEYWKRYREDPRLPSTPHKSYPDFPGLDKFLGKE
jgi:hypothetical protein